MLQDIRKSVNSIAIKVLMLVLLLSFVGFYGYSNRGAGCSPHAVAKVGGTLIGERDYMMRLQNQMETYRRLFNRDLDESIVGMVKKNVMDQTINRELLLQEAKKNSLHVSNVEVAKQIKESFADPKTKEFNADFYKNYLQRYLRMSPHKFEEQMRGDLLASKFQKLMGNADKVADDEIREALKSDLREVNIAFASLDPASQIGNTDVSEADLKAYFDKHVGNYQTEVKRKVEYVYLDPADYPIGKNETEAAQETKLQNAAKALADRLKSSPDKAWKDNLGEIKARYGNTDYFSQKENLTSVKDGMVIVNSAFAMMPNQISEPIKGWLSRGYYVMRVQAEQPSRQLSFDEAKGQVRINYNEEQATKRAEQQLDKAVADLKSGKTLAEVAKIYQLSVDETGLFKPAQAKTLPKIGFSNEAAKEISSLSLAAGGAGKRRWVERPIKVGARYYIFELKAENEAKPEEIAAQLEKERQDRRTRKQQEFFASWMKERRERAEKRGEVQIYRMEAAEPMDAPMF